MKTPPTISRARWCALFAACLVPLASFAQAADPPAEDAPAPAVPAPPIRTFEFYGSAQSLTDGNPSWREAGVRGNYQVHDHLISAEAATMKRWNEHGSYAAVGDTYTFNPDWFGSLSFGAGDGASYLPKYRVDAFLNHKMLPARNLVTTLGAGYYRAPDGHIDRNVSLGATYYFEMPLVVQGEMKFTRGSPGAVDTRQQFVAATWGRAKSTTVTGRFGWGEEGYQAIGGGAALVNFRSKEASVAVRHWFGPHWGAHVTLERYRSPYYQRSGVTGGLFWDLP